MVQPSVDNLERVAAALVELGADIDRELSTSDLIVNTQWRTQSGPIDILLSAAGPNETEITFRELVIRMKEAADRIKDHLALPELRRLRGDVHPERSRDVDPFEQFGIDDDLD